MRYWFTIMTAVLLAACAGQAPGSRANAPTPASVAREGEVCTNEYPTGTRIPKQVCRTPEEAATQKADADAMARRSLEAGNPRAGK
jgi:hypothetical protein